MESSCITHFFRNTVNGEIYGNKSCKKDKCNTIFIYNIIEGVYEKRGHERRDYVEEFFKNVEKYCTESGLAKLKNITINNNNIFQRQKKKNNNITESYIEYIVELPEEKQDMILIYLFVKEYVKVNCIKYIKENNLDIEKFNVRLKYILKTDDKTILKIQSIIDNIPEISFEPKEIEPTMVWE